MRELKIGEKFNRLTIVGKGKKTKNGQYYLVQCDCGSPIKEALGHNIIKNQVKSCGCLSIEHAKRMAVMGHVARKKHYGCMYCGSDKHYAKGYCKNCYMKLRRGTLGINLEEV